MTSGNYCNKQLVMSQDQVAADIIIPLPCGNIPEGSRTEGNLVISNIHR
jgi:hypothetical protein